MKRKINIDGRYYVTCFELKYIVLNQEIKGCEYSPDQCKLNQ